MHIEDLASDRSSSLCPWLWASWEGGSEEPRPQDRQDFSFCRGMVQSRSCDSGQRAPDIWENGTETHRSSVARVLLCRWGPVGSNVCSPGQTRLWDKW